MTSSWWGCLGCLSWRFLQILQRYLFIKWIWGVFTFYFRKSFLIVLLLKFLSLDICDSLPFWNKGVFSLLFLIKFFFWVKSYFLWRMKLINYLNYLIVSKIRINHWFVRDIQKYDLSHFSIIWSKFSLIFKEII